MDWGLGRYESTAAQLLSASEVVVGAAAIKPEERVVDVGCGTGNAALLAARAGARVTGIDPAPRLLEVARARAATEGQDIEFLSGDAASLPLGDASADVVLSVFGVIFAPDPVAAAAEMARVLGATGRLVLSAWVPGGAISDMNGLAADTMRQALGAPAGPPPFAWHELDAVTGLLAPHGFRVAVSEHALAFTASSPRAYLEEESNNHPLAVAGRRLLDQLGGYDDLHERMLRVLERGNEAPEAFRVTSTYMVMTASRAVGPVADSDRPVAGPRRRCPR